MFYRIKCVRNEVYQPADCIPRVTREYERGLLFLYEKKRTLIRQGFKYHTEGQKFFLTDPFGTSIEFLPSETQYAREELLFLLDTCCGCDDNFRITSEQVIDNGDGTYTITGIVGAEEGDTAIDELLNIYEYDGEFWILIEATPYVTYWDDLEGTPPPVSTFGNDVPYIKSIQPGDNVTVDYDDPENPEVSSLCAIQEYDTYEDFPTEPGNCVLYIDEETKRQYISGAGWVEIPDIALNTDYITFASLPTIGDPSLVYLTLGDLKAWYWVDGAYTETIFVSSGSTFPEPIDGEYVFFASSSELYEAVEGMGYLDVSPPTTNLFTKDLTLLEGREHDVDHNLTLKLGPTPFGVFKIERIDSTYPKLQTEFNRAQAKIYVHSNASTIYGIYISNSVQILTGQSNATINTGTKFLKRNSSGNSTWQDITVPQYVSDTAADNDSNLPSGAMYAVTGDRTVKRKP